MDLPLLKRELERQKELNLPRGLIYSRFKRSTRKNRLEERLIKLVDLRKLALENKNNKMIEYYNIKIEHLRLYMSVKCKKYNSAMVILK
jgi:hypothetical protein